MLVWHAQRRLVVTMNYLVADAPDGDGDTLGYVEAGLGNSVVILNGGVLNVKLRDGDLGNRCRRKLLQCCLNTCPSASTKMSLCACCMLDYSLGV